MEQEEEEEEQEEKGRQLLLPICRNSSQGSPLPHPGTYRLRDIPACRDCSDSQRFLSAFSVIVST